MPWCLSTTWLRSTPPFPPYIKYDTDRDSANEFTTSANKKTIMPADVFRALDETEYGFMRERVEAEFASPFPPSPNPFPCSN